MGTKILKSAVFIFLGVMLWGAMKESTGGEWIPLVICGVMLIGVWRGYA